MDMLGSPPQVRGKRQNLTSLLYYRRITPAGAGKTDYGYPRLPAHADHPRRCGENIEVRMQEWAKKGSPPQVRGKLPFRKGL